MSAESDLLFPQVDSFMLSDLSSFSEYDDFSKDIFTMNDIDGVALLEDLDRKPLSMSELNDFSSSLEGIKEEDEGEEDMHEAIKEPDRGNASKEGRELLLQGKLKSAVNGSIDGLCKEETTLESMVITEAGMSPRNMVRTEEEDLLQSSSSGNLWHGLGSSFEQAMAAPSSDDPSLTQGNQIVPHRELSITETHGIGAAQLSEISPALMVPIRERTGNGCSSRMVSRLMQVDTMPEVAPPIFHINSPLSSPSSSVSTPDHGSSLFKMFGQEGAAQTHHMNSSIAQHHAASADGDARIHHVAPGVSSLSAMPRSRSSHALGQFRTQGGQHLIPCPEESGALMEIGYSNLRNFLHYNQASSSPSLAEISSPATPMRRVFSTGDIQARVGDGNLTGSEHVISSEEHLGLKVGHYTVEERRVRLDRYRQKRNERNFSKKIKYACRKTLADSRPRIRGRFARTLDDSGEPLLRENGTPYDDDYEEVPFSMSNRVEGGVHKKVSTVFPFWEMGSILWLCAISRA